MDILLPSTIAGGFSDFEAKMSPNVRFKQWGKLHNLHCQIIIMSVRHG